MKHNILLIFFVLVLAHTANSQGLSRDLAITVTDNAGGRQDIRFGLASTATNGLDTDLGENELPPFPPTGVFEARFIGNDISVSELGLGSYHDYRAGDANFEGTVVHEIKYQAGASGNQINIKWDFPDGVSATLLDFFGGTVVNEKMQDSGDFVLTNLAVDRLKMTVTYVNAVTSVNDPEALNPLQFQLLQNYPNPFNPATQISYSLSEGTQVRLSVFNLLGQEVSRLVDQYQEAGQYDVTFRAGDLNSGIYLYKIQADQFSASRRLMLIK